MKKKIILLAVMFFLAAALIEGFIFYKTTAIKTTQTVWIAKAHMAPNTIVESSQVEAIEISLQESLVKSYYIEGKMPQSKLSKSVEPGEIIMKSHFEAEESPLEEASMVLALTAENAHLFECEAGEVIDIFAISEGQSNQYNNVKIIKGSVKLKEEITPGEISYVVIQTHKDDLLKIYEASINGSVRLLKKRHILE